MTLRSIYLTGTKFRRLVGTELDTRETYDLPLRRRLWLWRRGFLSRSDYLYDLEDGRHSEYLTDYERFVRTPRINGEWTVALSNKLVFHWMLAPFDEHRPDVYGMVRDGRFLPVDGDAPPGGSAALADGGALETRVPGDERGDATSEVARRLEREGDLVLKWIKGGGGHNVYLCSYRGGSYHVDGEERSADEFDDLVSGLDDYLVCEFVEQFDFGEALYPGTTNTLRIITMYDEAAGEPFVPVAIYRMGTDRSAPMDNFSQGGLSAEIGVETGELGPAAQLPEEELVFRDEHPDTGERIEGVELPGWETIRDRVLEMAAENAHVPYVGWDVVPTDDSGGFQVIEGNSYPGAKSLQVHRPLLEDERVREFYERHDVLRRSVTPADR